MKHVTVKENTLDVGISMIENGKRLIQKAIEMYPEVKEEHNRQTDALEEESAEN